MEEDTRESSALQEEAEWGSIPAVPLPTQPCPCPHCHQVQEASFPLPSPQMKPSVLPLRDDVDLQFVVHD